MTSGILGDTLHLFAGSWRDLNREHGFLRKLPNFLWPGLRYFTADDNIHKLWTSEDNTPRRHQDLWTCWPVVLMAGSLGWLVYFWGVKDVEMYSCSSEYLNVRSWTWWNVVREILLCFACWFVAQILFRHVVEPRVGVFDHSLRSLTTLANTAWGFLIFGMFGVQVMLAYTGPDPGYQEAVFLSMYFFQWLSAFFIVAPFLSYMVSIKTNDKVSESLFYLFIVVAVFMSAGRVLTDVSCGRADMEILLRRLTDVVQAKRENVRLVSTFSYACIRFSHTHAFALVMSIFLADGRYGIGIVEPDMFMIGELFFPIRQQIKAWIFVLALICIMYGGLMFVDGFADWYLKDFPGKDVLEDCRYGHLKVSALWHLLLNITCFVQVILAYLWQRKRRSIGSYHSQVVVCAGLFGILYHTYTAQVMVLEIQEPERQIDIWGTITVWFAIVIDFISYLSFVVLSADTFSGRIVFPTFGKQAIFFFGYSFWVFGDWVVIEASSLLENLWRPCVAMEQLGDAAQLWMLAGQAALAETGLFLMMGWTVHSVQKLVEHQGNAPSPPIDDAFSDDGPSARSATGSVPTMQQRGFVADGTSTRSRLGEWSAHIKKEASMATLNTGLLRGQSMMGRSFDGKKQGVWNIRTSQDMFGATGDPAVLSKSGVAEGIMQMCIRCEVFEDARIGEQEMRRFAILCGFTGTKEDWSKEYRSLCARHYWDYRGPDIEQFRLFLIEPADHRYQISPHLVELILKVNFLGPSQADPKSEKSSFRKPAASQQARLPAERIDPHSRPFH